jgi:hypothetical protein
VPRRVSVPPEHIPVLTLPDYGEGGALVVAARVEDPPVPAIAGGAEEQLTLWLCSHNGLGEPAEHQSSGLLLAWTTRAFNTLLRFGRTNPAVTFQPLSGRFPPQNAPKVPGFGHMNR